MADSGAVKGSLIGQTIGGYEVKTLIGRGAMGTVYLAHDVKLNRNVALKVLLGSMAQTPSVVRQFQLEAQAAAPLNHACVVRVYAAGIEKGTPYMAMEFVDGEPLDRFLRRIGKLKWQQAFHIGGQVALALDCAHRHGIVHRDVKPSNIMLDQQGEVRLTDFGIASIQSEEGGQDGMNFVGTPQYMSPEQCSNEKVGPASDLFALGVTVFQMISGEMPFNAESSMALIKTICTEDPPRLNKLNSSLPDDVARLVAYLLEKKPEMRPANARVVHSLMERVQEQKGGTSVVGQALTAFIKEEMEPRPFANLKASKAQRSKERKKSTIRRKSKRKGISRKAILRGALIGTLSIVAFLAGPLFSSFAREGRADKAPEVSLANFRDLGGGVLLAQFFADGYRFSHLAWIGDEKVVLVEAEGLAGTLMHDARGLLAIDTLERRFTNVRTPVGPVLDANISRLHIPSYAAQNVPPGAGRNPLSQSVLVHVRESANTPLLTLAQRWDESSPKPAVLYESDPSAWAQTSATNESFAVHGIVKPDGVTVCLVHTTPDGANNYLVERDVRARPLNATGPRLTQPAEPIVSASVQYAPDGAYLAYMRRHDDGRQDLWVTYPERGSGDDALLVANVVGDAFAIRPDGSQIAVRVLDSATDSDSDSGSDSIRIVDVYGKQIIWDLGPGLLSAEAWLPSGRELVIANATGEEAQRRGIYQLWAITATPPVKRTQLTHLRQGVEPIYAVSRDGRSVASVVANETFPTLAFIDLSFAGIDKF